MKQSEELLGLIVANIDPAHVSTLHNPNLHNMYVLYTLLVAESHAAVDGKRVCHIWPGEGRN